MGPFRTLAAALAGLLCLCVPAAAQIYPYVDTTGSTPGQVLTSNGAGVKPTFQNAGGGGGTPGGTSGQLQFNNGGVFGGATVGFDTTLGAPRLKFQSGAEGVIDTQTGGTLLLSGGDAADPTAGQIGALGGGGASGDGGAVIASAGNAATSGNGGGASLNGGNGAGAAGGGGGVNVEGGDGTGPASGGTITIAGGRPGPSSGNSGGAICNVTNGLVRFCIFATGDWNVTGSSGTAGQVLNSNGPGAAPTWSAASLSGTTASIGGGALAAGACSSGTVAVTSSTTAMVAMASPNTYPGDGAVWSAQVTAAGTVTVRVCAIVALTPTASTYNVRVLR